LNKWQGALTLEGGEGVGEEEENRKKTKMLAG